MILLFATTTFVPSFHTRAKASAHSVHLLAVTEVVWIESSKLGLGDAVLLLILLFATTTFVPSFHTRAEESAHSVHLLAVAEVVWIESSKLGLGRCAITDSTFCNNHLCSICSYESQRVGPFSTSVSCDGSSLDWEFKARSGTLCYYWFFFLQQPPLFHLFMWEWKSQPIQYIC